MGRGRTSTLLAVLASVALLVATVAGYSARSIGNSGQFANRAAQALEDDDVRALLSERITDQLILQQQADLIAFRPAIQSGVERVIGGRAFLALFRAAVADVHRAVFTGSEDTVVLTLRDIGTVAAEAVRKLQPELVTKLDRARPVEIVVADLDPTLGRVVDTVDRLRLIAWIAAALAAGLAAAALTLSPARRRTAGQLGVGTIGAGVLVLALLIVGRALVAGSADGEQQRLVRDALWRAYAEGLKQTAWVLVLLGAVLAGVSRSLVQRVGLGEPLERTWEFIRTEPLRVLRGLGFAAAGVALLVAREVVIDLLLTALGAYLLYEGVRMVIGLTGEPQSAATVTAPAPRRLWPAAIGVLVAATAVAALIGGGQVTVPGAGALASPGCNGARSLCDKSFDEVALLATHNSMSVPLPGWFSAEQDAPIADQLDDGVRGLLIDTYEADRLPNGRYRTAFENAEAKKRSEEESGLSPESVAAANRIRDRLGFAGEGARGLYLCHGFCELGATSLASVLADIRRFLVANPGEVLAIVHQDQIAPEDWVDAIRRARLEPFAYDGAAGGPWATLGEMVESGKRLVILNENRSGGAPWNLDAFGEALQETPFAFTDVSQLTDPKKLAASCEPNRGPAAAPLFQMNHWVNRPPAPRPTDAAKVNAYEPLLARARACAEQRGRPVNIVAVNFYRRGEALRAVRTLNGLR